MVGDMTSAQTVVATTMLWPCNLSPASGIMQALTSCKQLTTALISHMNVQQIVMFFQYPLTFVSGHVNKS